MAKEIRKVTLPNDPEAAEVAAVVEERIRSGTIFSGPVLPETWIFTERGRSVKVRFSPEAIYLEVK